MWLCQGVGYATSHVLQPSLKNRLLACYKRHWHSNIENNEKYRWFYSFKSYLEDAEKYLLVITNKWHGDSLARFRLGCCGLRSRTRWFCNDEQTRDSTCPSCSSGDVGEMHLLFVCIAYAEILRIYDIFNTVVGQPNENHVHSLLACKDQMKLKKLKICGRGNVRKKKEIRNKPVICLTL